MQHSHLVTHRFRERQVAKLKIMRDVKNETIHHFTCALFSAADIACCPKSVRLTVSHFDVANPFARQLNEQLQVMMICKRTKGLLTAFIETATPTQSKSAQPCEIFTRRQ